MRYGSLKLYWSSFTSVAALIFYLLAYFLLHDSHFMQANTWLWGVAGIGFAIYMGLLGNAMIRRISDEQPAQALLTIYAVTVVAFVTLGFSMFLMSTLLPFVFAAEILVLSYLDDRLSIKALRPIIVALWALTLYLFLPNIGLVLEIGAYSFVNTKMLSTPSLYLRKNLKSYFPDIFNNGKGLTLAGSRK